MDTMTRLLAVDCGTINTKAVLIDTVAGVYRLAARAEVPSSHVAPWNDITLGIREAIEKIEAQTDRTLLNQAGMPLIPAAQGNGIDSMVVTVSASKPLRVLLAGLTHGLSLNAARQALGTTCAVVVGQLTLDGEGLTQSVQDKIKIIQQTQADLLLFVGGIDNGAVHPVLELAQIIALGLKTLAVNQRPHLVYAGNKDLRAKLAEIFGGLTDYKSIDNVLPHFEHSNLQAAEAELDILYRQKKISRLPGYQTLSGWAGNRISLSAKSFAQTIHYLGQSYNIDIVGINVGSASSTLAVQKDNIRHTAIYPQYGLGRNLSQFINGLNLNAIQRWLPFEIETEALQEYLYNKSIYPQTVPETYADLLLETAVIREAIRASLKNTQAGWQNKNQKGRFIHWDLISGSGAALTRLPFPALAAMTLIDGLEPVGICTLSLDINNAASILGAVATIAPLAAVQVAGYDTLHKLGVVVAPYDDYRLNESEIKIKITYSDGKTIEAKIPFGAIESFPLKPGQTATLEVKRKSSGGIQAEVEGGAAGIIVDNRGRPLSFARAPLMQQERMQAWLAGMGLKPKTIAQIKAETEAVSV